MLVENLRFQEKLHLETSVGRYPDLSLSFCIGMVDNLLGRVIISPLYLLCCVMWSLRLVSHGPKDQDHKQKKKVPRRRHWAMKDLLVGRCASSSNEIAIFFWETQHHV